MEADVGLINLNVLLLIRYICLFHIHPLTKVLRLKLLSLSLFAGCATFIQ